MNLFRFALDEHFCGGRQEALPTLPMSRESALDDLAKTSESGLCVVLPILTALQTLDETLFRIPISGV